MKFNLFFPLLFIGLFIHMNNSNAQVSGKLDTSAQKIKIQQFYKLDQKKPLHSRVEKASAETFKTFRDAGMNPVDHSLTKEERMIVADAFDALPTFYQDVLKDHLQSIGFMDDMPNTALTSPLNFNDPYRLYNITFRAAILRETVSEWLTWKERTCFNVTGSEITVTVDGGKMNALAYVLMHEATHVLDGSLGILSDDNPGSRFNPAFDADNFIKDVWADRIQFNPSFKDSLLLKNRFHSGGIVLPADQAIELYKSLQKTPLVSLYSTSSWHEDLAEYASVYHFTQILKQPFRIVIYKKGKEVFQYEPMKSKQVAGRRKMVRKFYS
jgi:hypothetical protein